MPPWLARSSSVVALGAASLLCSAAGALPCEAGAPACHDGAEDDVSVMQLKAPARHKTIATVPQVEDPHRKNEVVTWVPVDGGFDRACRAGGGHNSDSFYTVRDGLSDSACKDLCGGNATCTGVEISDNQHGGRCELWHVPISTTAPVAGYDCYRKRMGLPPPGLDFEGYGDYWELVDADGIASTLPYLREDSGAPSCMQGLVWMDQECTTYWSLPWHYKCRNIFGFASVNEYTSGFSNWDASTKCLSFGRRAWTFGDPEEAATICEHGDVRFCQTNSDTKGPCDEGARFKGPGGDPMQFFLEKTSFGWDRHTTTSVGYEAHYPLFQIVDGHGTRTSYYENYLEEATQTWCGLFNPHIPFNLKPCRKSYWASEGKLGLCTRARRGR